MNGGIETAKLDWGTGVPRSVFFDDVYFSGDGADEARHVFLDGNDLAERFKAASLFSIGELGFGTGLNVLAAWDLWRRTPKRDGARLHFLSFEKFPLAADDLARAHRLWPQFAALSGRLAAALREPAAGFRRIDLDADVTLTLAHGDAREMLLRAEARIDAWFLDGFAPARHPELWRPEIFAEIAALSSPGATAATFTVAGAVRRALAAAGFTAEKRKGYGRKREMLTARLSAPAPLRSRRAPWFQNADLEMLKAGAQVGIVGGGVAGASLAREFIGAGLAATIIDAGGVAAGASGNVAALVMPRLDRDDNAPARFFRAAYLHALATIGALQEKVGENFFNPCGVLLEASDDDDRRRREMLLDGRFLPQGFIERRGDGLYFPQAGVISPRAFCVALAKDAALIVRRAASIARRDAGVAIRFEGGGEKTFDAVVLANGVDALRFVEARTLPLTAVAGQADFFPGAPPIGFAIVSGPYIAPAPGGGVVIGATRRRTADHAPPATSIGATRENIAAIGAAAPERAASLGAASSVPFAALRCETPDRLPVAGPVPDWNFFAGAYDGLRTGKPGDYPPGAVYPNVFILAGLGSRGFVTAPLCAAMMVAEMTGAPSPAGRDVAEALHPARFFIRDLKRARRIRAR